MSEDIYPTDEDFRQTTKGGRVPVTEVLYHDADGDEFPIGFPGHAPSETDEESREWLKEEALNRIRFYTQQGHLRPREPLTFVSLNER